MEGLRSAVRFLRSENALLKSRHLYSDLDFLKPSPTAVPALRDDTTPSAVPELSTSSPSSPTSESSLPLTPTTPPTRHSLETESKLLLRDITNQQTRPRIVDISNIQHDHKWRSRKNNPDMQVHAWKREEEKLGRRLNDLKNRMRDLKAR